MAYDLKTATVDTTISINGFFFGADSQASANPSVYKAVNVIGVAQTSKSADYTLTLADAGTHILHPSTDASGRTFTIPSNASVAYPIGTVITFINAGGTVTIAINTDTMYLAGAAATTGSRTLDAYGMASAIKIGTNTWVISGANLS